MRKAIDKAIDRCIDEGVLREFLVKRRGEVTKVTQLDYTFDRRLELELADAREEAREEALAEERVNTERERNAKEKERQRAELAEIEVQRLRAELERYKRQFPEA